MPDPTIHPAGDGHTEVRVDGVQVAVLTDRDAETLGQALADLYGLAGGEHPAGTLAGQVARILHERDHGPGSETRLLNRLDTAYTTYLAARGLPAHGTRGTCRRCGAPIEYAHSVDGHHYWRHLGVDVQTPHGAVPGGHS